jgi:hypothetical protein
VSDRQIRRPNSDCSPGQGKCRHPSDPLEHTPARAAVASAQQFPGRHTSAMRRGTSGVSEATALLRTARAGWTDKTGRLSIEYSLRKYADGTHVVDHHAEPA